MLIFKRLEGDRFCLQNPPEKHTDKKKQHTMPIYNNVCPRMGAHIDVFTAATDPYGLCRAMLRYAGYFTQAPSAHLRSAVSKLRVPSGFSALRIIPWLSMPRNLRGGRLAMKHICRPTSSSGL